MKVHARNPYQPFWPFCGMAGHSLMSDDVDEITCSHCLRKLARQADESDVS